MLDEQLNLQETRPDTHPPLMAKTILVRSVDNADLLLKLKSVWEVAASWGRFCDEDLGDFIKPNEAQSFLPDWLLNYQRFNLETWLSDLHDREWIWWSSAIVEDYLKLDILAEAMPLSTWPLVIVIEAYGGKVVYDDLWIEPSQIEDKLSLRKRNNRLNNCVYRLTEVILAGLALTVACICLVFLALYIERDRAVKNHHAEVRQQQEKWETLQPEDYIITYESVGQSGIYGMGTAKATICDDIMVKAENPYCNDPSTGCQTELGRYEYPMQDPVETLFQLADECLDFCSVSYDSDYGYPTHVGGGFIEGGWISVTDFEIISCGGVIQE
ncbi:MAG: DUF6174 domain-containing protein [Anaerolineae bacterium]|nr:DUF6174 domain-containing protein [Anaerolineae bacterium]